MKNKFLHLSLFIILNLITIFSILYCNRDMKPLPISACYQNLLVFFSCVFFANISIFKKEDKVVKLLPFLQHLFFYNSMVCCIVFVLVLFIALLLGGQSFLSILFITTFQFFLLLILHSLFLFLVSVDKNLRIKGDYYLLGTFLFIYMFYIFIYSYGNNVLFINIYRYLFMGFTGIYVLWHYLFWFCIPCVIIGIKYRNNLGGVYDRVKKCKKRI